MHFYRPVVFLLLLFFFTACGRTFYPYSAVQQQEPFALDLSRYKSPQERDNQDKKLVLGLAISGGGSRASYFGLGVMMELERLGYKDSSNILNEVDYLSTVSGGGFAGGYYISHFAHEKKYYPYKKFSLNAIWKHANECSNALPDVDLNSTIFKNIFIHNLFAPGRRMRQLLDSMRRSILLEGKTDANKNAYQRLLLKDIFIDTASQEKVITPILITNGTFYANNSRLPIVPYLIDELNITGCYQPNVDFDGSTMPLFYGITASSSFPGVLLQIRLKRSDSTLIRVIDGGVSDNFGYKSLVDIYRKMPEKQNHRLIVIDASGQGVPSPVTGLRNVGLFKVIGKMLYSGLESRYATSQQEIGEFFKNDSSFSFIGITSIRKYCEANEFPIPELINVKQKLSWPNIYDTLVKRIGKPITYQSDVDIINTPEKYWLLYELAAQVKTKLDVFPEERALLVLAGRVAVRLNEERLRKLVSVRN